MSLTLSEFLKSKPSYSLFQESLQSLKTKNLELYGQINFDLKVYEITSNNLKDLPENDLIGLFEESHKNRIKYEQIMIKDGKRHCKNAVVIFSTISYF